MGNNIDLCVLLGVPKKTKCRRCRLEFETNFDDYDIDCGHPEACRIENQGLISLDAECPHCGLDSRMRFAIIPEYAFLKIRELARTLIDIDENIASIIGETIK